MILETKFDLGEMVWIASRGEHLLDTTSTSGISELSLAQFFSPVRVGPIASIHAQAWLNGDTYDPVYWMRHSRGFYKENDLFRNVSDCQAHCDSLNVEVKHGTD